MALATLIRATALEPRPWANGLGVSRTILTQEAGPGGGSDGGEGAGFAWTIAIADLPGDADFSHYPGIDRVFTIIEGQGASLTIEGSGTLRCLPFLPASFPGDRPTHCRMDGIPGRAFNLLLDRARCRGQVLPRSLAAGHPVHAPAQTSAIHCLAGRIAVAGEVLAPGDTLLPAEGATMQAVEGAAIALLVTIAAA